MQQFLKDTIESRFIKALLYNSYLPIYDTVSKGDYIIKGRTYVYCKDIIRCTKSGYIGGFNYIKYKYLMEENSEYLLTEAEYEMEEEDSGNFEATRDKSSFSREGLSVYDFGVPYPKYTDNFIAKNAYYDSDTHRRLGKYLRCYRDLMGIDLMPFYNCFDGSYVSKLSIKQTGVVNNPRSTHKIYQVPIKYNTTYTIAIDSQSEVWLAPVVIKNNTFLTVTRGAESEDFDLTAMLAEKPDAIVRYRQTTFTKPFTYHLNNTDENTEDILATYEKDLYLLIQVVGTNRSSLTVLEGDYTNTNSNKIFSADHLDDIDDTMLNNLLLSNLSLLQFSDGISYPYSNRLLEYLLDGVITHEDIFSGDVKRLQAYLHGNDTYIWYKGIWDSSIRYDIYKRYLNNKNYRHLDNNGFIDKDLENMINKEGVVSS